jgi:phytoene dehydrogenase-like protein
MAAVTSLPARDVDVLVVGAGFGGLGAAMGLVDRGASVMVCERLDYAGGCAGTFTRGGCHYDAGATLSSGFGPGPAVRGLGRAPRDGR